MYSSYREEEKHKANNDIKEEFNANYESTLVDANGNTYNYTICNKSMGRFFAAIGGLFVGMISVGLAELEEYHLVARCKVPTPVAVATSIFAVVITVLFASIGHVYHFVTAADSSVIHQVLNVVLFTIPGVVIGGQIGPYVQKRVNPDFMKIGISFLFVVIGLFMLFTLMK